ncbi:MAG: LD-carboxypeptidase, partial [Sphaerochaeta sp.]
VPSPSSFTSYLRSYGTLQILQKVSAIIFGKPYQGRYYDEYVRAIRQVLAELDLSNLVVVTNMAFGHNEPMCILPYGAMAELDCTKKTFTILESGVV